MVKECSVCADRKPSDQFQVRAASHDGLTAACKSCLKKRDAKRYKKEKPYRANQHRLYMETSAGKRAHSKAASRWRETNKTKRAAHVLLGNALRAGKIERRPCEMCGNRRAHAHHEDYAKPLEVTWLCARHHREVHDSMRRKNVP